MNLNIIVDTGFWIALFNPGKEPQHNLEAERMAKEMEDENIIVPFPTLYEFVNSRLSRRESKLQFEMLLNRPNVTKFPDSKYKVKALENFFIRCKLKTIDCSLVDEVLKLIIEDKTTKIDYIATFDQELLNYAINKGIKSI